MFTLALLLQSAPRVFIISETRILLYTSTFFSDYFSELEFILQMSYKKIYSRVSMKAMSRSDE